MINISKIAELSNLELTPGEATRLSSDLEEILGMVQHLPDLEDAGVMVDSGQPVLLRKDIIVASYPRDVLLQNAPDASNGCFVVPKTVE